MKSSYDFKVLFLSLKFINFFEALERRPPYGASVDHNTHPWHPSPLSLLSFYCRCTSTMPSLYPADDKAEEFDLLPVAVLAGYSSHSPA